MVNPSETWNGSVHIQTDTRMAWGLDKPCSALSNRATEEIERLFL